jgi:hypothetical protein
MSTMTRSCSSTRGAAGQQPGRHDRLHPGRPARHPDDSRRGRADPGLQPVGCDRAHRGPALHTGRRGPLPGHAPARRRGPVRQLRPEAPVTGPLTWLKRRGTYTPVCRGRVPIPQRRFNPAQGMTRATRHGEQAMCAESSAIPMPAALRIACRAWRSRLPSP